MTTAPTLWDARRQAQVESEADLPVKLKLVEMIAGHGARLQAAFAKLNDLWPTYDVSTAWKAEAALKRLNEEFIDAVANLHRALPTSSICICPGCRKVTLPTASGSYQCRPCGRLWFFHRSSNFKQLPVGFWDTHLPGDEVKKRLLSDEQQEDVA